MVTHDHWYLNWYSFHSQWFQVSFLLQTIHSPQLVVYFVYLCCLKLTCFKILIGSEVILDTIVVGFFEGL